MPDQNLTKAQRRDAARAEALELRKAQERRERRNRTITFVVLGVLVVAVAVAVVLIMKANKDANTPKALSEVTAPKTANSIDDGGGVPFGKDGVAGTTTDGAVTVDLYYDYMCPVCGQFEKVNQADIDSMRAAGEITFVAHPVTFLDDRSQGTEYSTRAANAFATVADAEPDKALALHEALYANRPEENTKGPTDDQIKSIAEQAGVSDKVADTFTDKKFSDWADAWTTQILGDKDLANPSSGSFGTPTILINGKMWGTNAEWNTAGALKAAVEAAAKG
ncbi:DsbA family protein [Luteimicrobium subarcticum]|uniref:Protein-disulfide isomerase n=1 Tax=Luteimicrobium subarcticum TaxID=620910 RepID=A0A2M8WSW1_9MICO|nr:thioredoxin domain-containing protein [Luteimicrobium subarcticum]PJI93978.1 protein-disulfide isomerase [Luteimicrobium subarcticum]